MGGSKTARLHSGRHRLIRLKLDADACALVSCVAKSRRVGMRALLGGDRGSSDLALARQISIYLLRVLLGRRYENIGELFWRSRSTVQHACHVIEQLREDDPLLDAQIAKIECLGWGEADEVRHAA